MNRFRKSAEKANAKFFNQYGDTIKKLQGISDEDLNKLIPDTADRKIYDDLVKVVQEAETKNLQQAALVDNIKKLGNVALSIARNVPSLAAILPKDIG